MPRGDRTGPQGRGPRTGRGLGSCPPGETAYPNTQPGNPVLGLGRGLGRGFAGGFGRGIGRGRWGGFRNPMR